MLARTRTPAPHLSPVQIVEIYNHIKDVVEVVDPENKLVRYKVGHSDATVAEKFRITHNQAQGQRVAHFGRLWTQLRGDETTEQRVTALEARVVSLERLLDELTTK